jgi:hypothetical protein
LHTHEVKIPGLKFSSERRMKNRACWRLVVCTFSQRNVRSSSNNFCFTRYHHCMKKTKIQLAADRSLCWLLVQTSYSRGLAQHEGFDQRWTQMSSCGQLDLVFLHSLIITRDAKFIWARYDVPFARNCHMCTMKVRWTRKWATASLENENVGIDKKLFFFNNLFC